MGVGGGGGGRGGGGWVHMPMSGVWQGVRLGAQVRRCGFEVLIAVLVLEVIMHAQIQVIALSRAPAHSCVGPPLHPACKARKFFGV
jgi:hypothetical protein